MKHCLFKNETIVKSIDTFHAAKNVRPLVEKKKKSKPNENRVENFEKGKKKKGREGKKKRFCTRIGENNRSSFNGRRTSTRPANETIAHANSMEIR